MCPSGFLERHIDILICSRKIACEIGDRLTKRDISAYFHEPIFAAFFLPRNFDMLTLKTFVFLQGVGNFLQIRIVYAQRKSTERNAVITLPPVWHMDSSGH